MDDLTQIPLGKGVRVIQSHECGLLLLDKPDGILSMPNRESEINRSLVCAKYDAKRECYHWKDASGATREVYLCNRLDSPTSGVVVCALNAVVAETLNRLFRERKTHKSYLAVVGGVIKENRGEWRDRLGRERKNGKLSVDAAEDGMPAFTRWTVLKRRSQPVGITLLRLEPGTGRTHQLRVQCSLRHHGILGDRNYGEFALNKRVKQWMDVGRLCLHAHRIQFELNVGRARIQVDAESRPPALFDALFA